MRHGLHTTLVAVTVILLMLTLLLAQTACQRMVLPPGQQGAQAGCPKGCSCMTIEEAKKLGYELCGKQMTRCGTDASGNPLYCFESTFTPTQTTPVQTTTFVPAQCPYGCTCMTIEEAKKLGYDLCGKKVIECGQDSNGNLLYCVEKPTGQTTQCPAGCTCMTIEEAKKLGYDFCQKQEMECGRDASGAILYCVSLPAAGVPPIMPAKLVIEPQSDRNQVGTKHSLTFILLDERGNPVPHIRLYISHTGANTLLPIELETDDTGKTGYSYTGVNAGTDYIVAKTGTLVANATKEWYGTATQTTPVLPGRITVNPASDRNQVGTTHTITIMVYSSAGTPMQGSRVRITHSGANIYLPAELVTDSNGMVKYSYIGNKSGTDTLTITMGSLSATATKEWYTQTTGVSPARLTLTPTNASNPPGKQHTVTATVTGSDGKPMNGVEVIFSVTGVNNFARHVTTDVVGQASISYTSKQEGKDTIAATVGGLKATATKWWEVIR